MCDTPIDLDSDVETLVAGTAPTAANASDAKTAREIVDKEVKRMVDPSLKLG